MRKTELLCLWHSVSVSETQPSAAEEGARDSLLVFSSQEFF